MKKRILSSSIVIVLFAASSACSDGTRAGDGPEPRSDSAALRRTGAGPSAAAFGSSGQNVAVSFVADACTVGERQIDATCDHLFVEAFPIAARAWSLDQWAPEGNLHVRQGSGARMPDQYVRACICPAGAGDVYHPQSCAQPLVPVDGYTDATGELHTNLPYSGPNATGQITDPVHTMQVSGWSSLVTIDVAGTPTLIECRHGATC